MKGLILCGGKGTRLRPFSHSRPKHLLPVANQPVIQYAIEKMSEAGIDEIGIVIPPYFKSQFEEVLGNTLSGAVISYIEQKEPKGLADAVNSARYFIKDDSFLLFLGDNFFGGELSPLVQRVSEEKSDALIMVSQVANPSQFGVVQFEGSRIVRLLEKPKNPPSNYAIVGIYLFTPSIFAEIDRLIPSPRGEYEITDAIQGLINNGKKVIADVTEAWWKDTGKPNDLLACNRHVLLDLRGENYGSNVRLESAAVEGPVVIQAGAQVINSVIRGPVMIGGDARIVNSYVGPFTSIGESVQIENSEIENSIVLERTHITSIPKRIDESVIGGEVTMKGEYGSPRSLRVNLGDHAKMYLPITGE